MRLALTLAILVVAAGPAGAAGRPAQLLHEEAMANDLCRGGAGSATDEACDLRELLDADLKRAGWCFGRPGDENESVKTWHPCGR